MSERIIAGIGMARYLPEESAKTLSLDLGQYHPSAHGGLQLDLTVDDGRVTNSEARIGLMHRSTEKLFEARDYRQIMMLANRHDWLSAVSSEIGVALAVEQATGITPSDRVTWSRMLLTEAGRISAISLFAAAGGAADALTMRERLAQWQEDSTGGRVHPMINRIGGLEHPIPETALQGILEICEALEAVHGSWTRHFQGREELSALAVLKESDAREFACSGAVGQASGVDWDLRRDDPYLHYGQLDADWAAPVRSAGDAQSRYLSLVDQLPISSAIIKRCVQEVSSRKDEPFAVSLPKTLRAPEGLVHVRTQNPLGIASWLLVSDGATMPVRLKARTPSFAHLQAMQRGLIGTPIKLLSEAVGSFFFVTGDADR
jgi:NADH-quinone oxidoreductase subunit D